MLAKAEREPRKVRWYLDDFGLHILVPGGAFLSVSMRALELAGYDGEHPGRALKKMVEDGDAMLIDLPANRGGVGPLLKLSVEQATSLQRDFAMPIGKGLRPVLIPAERWGRA